MNLPISTIVDLVNAFVCGSLAVRLGRAMHQDPASRMIRYFFYTYAALTTAYALLTVPRLVASQQTVLLGYAFSFGILCFLIATAFFSRVVLTYTMPSWARPFFPAYLGLSIIASVWLLIDRAAPVVDSATGITNWNTGPAVGLFTAILFLLVLLPGAILFLRQAMLAKDNHVVRIRSLTIGLGSMFLATSAALVFSATTEVLAVIGDFFSSGALLIIFLGVAYHRPKALPPLPPSNSPTTTTPHVA